MTRHLGPVFISYRQSDGKRCATDLARALRAAGIPVWHDQADLPPGAIKSRLKEALTSGLSGAVLLITPEIARSEVVKETELPPLLELADDPLFVLAVAYTKELEERNGSYDYSLPDCLLDQQSGTLKEFKQFLVSTPEERSELATKFLRHRLTQIKCKSHEACFLLSIDIQTRTTPAGIIGDSHLIMRLSPPVDNQRRPNPDGLHDLSYALKHFTQEIASCGVKKIRVSGAAHLSVAFALGAAFPTTRIGEVEVVDHLGKSWILRDQIPTTTQFKIIDSRSISRNIGQRKSVLAYVDILPHRSDAAFFDFIEHENDFAEVVQLLTKNQEHLKPEDAHEIVGELNNAIRLLAGQHSTSEVHLLLRCPFPVALQLGRVLNTLTVHLYEWEDGSCPNRSPSYVPSMIVQAGLGGSPIQSVTAY